MATRTLTAEDQQAFDELRSRLAVTCPLTSASDEAFDAFVGKIDIYAEKVGVVPPLQTMLRWGAELEKPLREANAAAEEQQRKEREREQQIAEARRRSLSPSSEERAEVIREFRERQPKIEPAPFVPNREYSEAEMDAMDSETYRLKVLGHKRSEDVNFDRPVTRSARDEDQARTKKQILRRPVKGVMDVSLRRRALGNDPEEAARATRQREIERDKELRKAVKADIRKALEGR